MTRREFFSFSGMGIVSLLLGGCGVSMLEDKKEATVSAQKTTTQLAYQVRDASLPVVHLIRTVDEDAMLRAYESAGRRSTRFVFCDMQRSVESGNSIIG